MKSIFAFLMLGHFMLTSTLVTANPTEHDQKAKTEVYAVADAPDMQAFIFCEAPSAEAIFIAYQGKPDGISLNGAKPLFKQAFNDFSDTFKSRYGSYWSERYNYLNAKSNHGFGYLNRSNAWLENKQSVVYCYLNYPPNFI